MRVRVEFQSVIRRTKYVRKVSGEFLYISCMHMPGPIGFMHEEMLQLRVESLELNSNQ